MRRHFGAGGGRYARVAATLGLILLVVSSVAQADAAAASVSLRWNIDAAPANGAITTGTTPAVLTLTNRGTEPLTAQGWALYFSCLAGV